MPDALAGHRRRGRPADPERVPDLERPEGLVRRISADGLRHDDGRVLAWMRDNWNHPSLVIWDASNETVARSLAEQIIPEVRTLDLSGRPWENGYNLPSGPDDPTEDHNYMYLYAHGKLPTFKMTDLERMTGAQGLHLGPPDGARHDSQRVRLALARIGTARRRS